MIRNYRNAASDAWFSSIIEDPSLFPMSFTYNGKEYHGFGDTNFVIQSCTREEKNGKDMPSVPKDNKRVFTFKEHSFFVRRKPPAVLVVPKSFSYE